MKEIFVVEEWAEAISSEWSTPHHLPPGWKLKDQEYEEYLQELLKG